MSFFNTTASLRHATPLPAGVDQSQAVKTMLQDHKAYIECAPHSVHYEKLKSDETAKLAATALASQKVHPLPDSVRAVVEAYPADVEGKTYAVYRVTDIIPTLPAGLWDSKVDSTYEMIDITSGVYVRIRSPMSVVLDTTWTISAIEGSDQLELVEEVAIYCSRLLMGTVKGLCESGWQKIHANMIKELMEGKTTELPKQ
ncbi:hypothetical protein SEPCBS119000_002601 [Sporothrix epigloea]|uniref:DUF7053 domain-containing protein n=1 Tax=Sporothrix epigloea TaxID=1892477 RepID=A0ABP0DH06_9PEZI